MQDGTYEHVVPLSQMLKEAYSAGKVTQDGYCDSMMSEASSHDLYFDSLSDLQEDGVCGSPVLELSAFLSQEEMCKSLDLARVAIAESSSEEADPEPELADTSRYFRQRPSANLPQDPPPAGPRDARRPDGPEAPASRNAESGGTANGTGRNAGVSRADPTPSSEPRTGQPNLPSTDSAVEGFDTQGATISSEADPARNSKVKEKAVFQSESSARNEFCNKAVSFIEELSSIFRTARPRRSAQEKNKSIEEDSSSPDSGYLSPKNHVKVNTASAGKTEPSESKLTAAPDLEPGAETEQSWLTDQVHEGGAETAEEDLTGSAPRFTQKLKSQEVAEGNRVRLACRVLGVPRPLVRYVRAAR